MTRDNFEAIVLSFIEDCNVIKEVIAIQLDYSIFDKVIQLYNDCELETSSPDYFMENECIRHEKTENQN